MHKLHMYVRMYACTQCALILIEIKYYLGDFSHIT